MNPNTISASYGGMCQLFFDFDVSHAGNQYLVIASVAGTAPGFSLNGVDIPLTRDFLTDQLLYQNYYPMMVGFSDNLSFLGNGTALFLGYPGLLSRYIGMTAHFAVVSFGSSWTAVGTTNSYPMTILP